LLTDVNGIYLEESDPNTKLSKITTSDAKHLIESGRATGGMVPKIESLIDLVGRGVHSAHIVSGTVRNAILAEVFTDSGTGTMVVKD